MSAEPDPDVSSRSDSIRQRVTWAELFVDLVWVFAVTQIAATLTVAHGIGAVAKTLLLFVPLWWGWVGVTLLGNASGEELDRARGRLTLFLLAGCALGMTVAVPHAYDHHGVLYAGGYVALRLLLWAGLRRNPLAGGLHLDPFTVSLLISAPLFVAGSLLEGRLRLAIWALAAAVEVLNPLVLGHRLHGLRVEAEHLPERFGLFLIIALGETVVAVGGQAANSSLDAPTLATVALAFGLIVALWWTYFHFGAAAVQHSLKTDAVQARIVRDVFSYLHFGYVVGIIFVAVGLKKLLADPLAHPHTVVELLLAPGVGLYLLCFSLARWRMFGAVGLPRFVAALLCVPIALAAPLLPAVAGAGCVVAVLAAVNGLEAWLFASRHPLPVMHAPRRAARRADQRGG